MKKRKFLNILFVLLISLCFSMCVVKYVNADSGYDFSYDQDSSSSFSDSPSSDLSVGMTVSYLVIFGIAFVISRKMMYMNNKHKIFLNKKNYISIDDELLQKNIPTYTISSLKETTLSLYNKSRNFISSNDIHGLESVASSEQIESYLKEIKEVKKRNFDLNFKSIKFSDFKVFDVKRENDKVIVKTYLNVYIKFVLTNKDTKKKNTYFSYRAVVVELSIGDKVIINREEVIDSKDMYREVKSVTQTKFFTNAARIFALFVWIISIMFLASISALLSIIYESALLSLFLFVCLGVYYANSIWNCNKNFIKQAYNYYDLTDDEIKEYLKDYNSEKLKKEAFDLYNNIQDAWMNFDYDKLRNLCTDELYNAYKSQLESLKVRHRKNIIEDITYLNSRVTDISVVNNIVSVELYMTVKLKDYIVDEGNGVVERGNKKSRLLLAYRLTIVKSLDNKKYKCPNCGSDINLNTSAKCEYCGSTIVIPPKKFVLSKKSLNEKENKDDSRGTY